MRPHQQDSAVVAKRRPAVALTPAWPRDPIMFPTLHDSLALTMDVHDQADVFVHTRMAAVSATVIAGPSVTDCAKEHT